MATAAHVPPAHRPTVGPPPSPNRATYPYQGTIRLPGLPLILVENLRGSYREGVDPDGHPWRTRMPHHYGEFEGTRGADGDPVDVFVGPDAHAPSVYVVHMRDFHGGGYDEDKVCVAFRTRADVIRCIAAAYDRPGVRMGIRKMSLSRFLQWLADHGRKGNKITAGKELTKALEWARMGGDPSHGGKLRREPRQERRGRKIVLVRRWRDPDAGKPLRHGTLGVDDALVRRLAGEITATHATHDEAFDDYTAAPNEARPHHHADLHDVNGKPVRVRITVTRGGPGRRWTGHYDRKAGEVVLNAPSEPVPSDAWRAGLRNVLAHELTHVRDPHSPTTYDGDALQQRQAAGTITPDDLADYVNSPDEATAFLEEVVRDLQRPDAVELAARAGGPADWLKKASPRWGAIQSYMDDSTRRRFLRAAAAVWTNILGGHITGDASKALAWEDLETTKAVHRRDNQTLSLFGALDTAGTIPRDPSHGGKLHTEVRTDKTGRSTKRWVKDPEPTTPEPQARAEPRPTPPKNQEHNPPPQQSWDLDAAVEKVCDLNEAISSWRAADAMLAEAEADFEKARKLARKKKNFNAREVAEACAAWRAKYRPHMLRKASVVRLGGLDVETVASSIEQSAAGVVKRAMFRVEQLEEDAWEAVRNPSHEWRVKERGKLKAERAFGRRDDAYHGGTQYTGFLSREQVVAAGWSSMGTDPEDWEHTESAVRTQLRDALQLPTSHHGFLRAHGGVRVRFDAHPAIRTDHFSEGIATIQDPDGLLPLGAGMIRMNSWSRPKYEVDPETGIREEQGGLTLAHELGHVVDWYIHRALKGRTERELGPHWRSEHVRQGRGHHPGWGALDAAITAPPGNFTGQGQGRYDPDDPRAGRGPAWADDAMEWFAEAYRYVYRDGAPMDTSLGERDIDLDAARRNIDDLIARAAERPVTDDEVRRLEHRMTVVHAAAG